ncbi:hypothetical protein SCAR479_07562 [Seiridium cardinale]|uniref:Hexose transporter n=1 Tax=Seiridium cardinale TaxID=138064 RepID=A0ABR2XPK4_9PEZI
MEMEAKSNSSYLDFFRTNGNRYRFTIWISLGLFSQVSGNAIISNYASVLYEVAGIHDSNSRLGLQGGQAILALVVSLSTAMTVDRFGRRPLFLIATGGMFVVFIFWTFEILPYVLRAKGRVILNIRIQAALTLNAYANPVAFAAFGEMGYWKLYLIYTYWIFLELFFVCLAYVKTRGPTLEELSKLIDGMDANIAYVDLEQIEKCRGHGDA